MAADDAESSERLDVLAATNDGFKVAEEDLRLRKAGELAGTTQAGANETIGNIVDDFALYMQAKGAAEAIVSADPELDAPEHRSLRALIDDVAAARALLVTA
jgi:ATP-dependent DNA helicase RecG